MKQEDDLPRCFTLIWSSPIDRKRLGHCIVDLDSRRLKSSYTINLLTKGTRYKIRCIIYHTTFIFVVKSFPITFQDPWFSNQASSDSVEFDENKDKP